MCTYSVHVFSLHQNQLLIISIMSTYAGTGCGLKFPVGTVVASSLFSLLTATVVLVLVSAFQIIQVKKLSKA